MGQPSQYGPRIRQSRRSRSLSRMKQPLRVAIKSRTRDMVASRPGVRASPLSCRQEDRGAAANSSLERSEIIVYHRKTMTDPGHSTTLAPGELDERLEAHRLELTGYCYRMLGSPF